MENIQTFTHYLACYVTFLTPKLGHSIPYHPALTPPASKIFPRDTT